MRILIAEPDSALAKRLVHSLRGLHAGSEGDEPEITVTEVSDTFSAARQERPTLLVLALAAGAEAQSALADFPAAGCAVIVLAADPAPQTRAACLLAGADDCLSKPLSMVELRARCLLALRRLRNAALPALSHTVSFGALKLDRLRREACIGTRPLPLTSRELLILEQLALANGGLVTRSALRRAVWQGSPGQTNALDVHLTALRRKLRARAGAPEIGNVRGTGFYLLAGEIPAPALPASLWSTHALPCASAIV